MNSEGSIKMEIVAGGSAEWLNHEGNGPLSDAPSTAELSSDEGSPTSNQREGTPRKKKENLADLGLDLMNTVTECAMDSRK